MTLLAQIGQDEINAARDFLASLDLIRLMIFIVFLLIILLGIIAFFVLKPNKNNNEAIKAANDAAVSANKAAESANATTQSALRTLNQHQEVLKGLTDTISEFRQGINADRGAITGNTESISMLHGVVEQIALATKAVADAVERSVEAENQRHSSLTGGISLVKGDIEKMSRSLMDKLTYITQNIEQRWGNVSHDDVVSFKKSIEHIEQMMVVVHKAVIAAQSLPPVNGIIPTPLPALETIPPPAGEPLPNPEVKEQTS